MERDLNLLIAVTSRSLERNIAPKNQAWLPDIRNTFTSVSKTVSDMQKQVSDTKKRHRYNESERKSELHELGRTTLKKLERFKTEARMYEGNAKMVHLDPTIARRHKDLHLCKASIISVLKEAEQMTSAKTGYSLDPLVRLAS